MTTKPNLDIENNLSVGKEKYALLYTITPPRNTVFMTPPTDYEKAFDDFYTFCDLNPEDTYTFVGPTERNVFKVKEILKIELYRGIKNPTEASPNNFVMGREF